MRRNQIISEWCAAVLLLAAAVACGGRGDGANNSGESSAPSLSQGARDSAKTIRSAQAFVQRFYDWYAPYAVKTERGVAWNIVLADSAAWITPTLRDALIADAKARAASPDAIDGLDFDPFLESQDPCEPYVAGSARMEHDSYVVPVQLMCPGVDAGKSRPTLIVELAHSGGEWRLANVLYPNNAPADDLLSLLKRLRERRERQSKSAKPRAK